MKTMFRVFGVIVITVIFSFAFIACDNGSTSSPNENPKSLRITGVTGDDVPASGTYDLIRFRIFSGTHSAATLVAGYGRTNFTSFNDNQVLQVELCNPTEGQVTTGSLETISHGGINNANPVWTGYGEHFIMIQFVNSGTVIATFWYTNGADLNAVTDVARYSFTSDLSTIDFSKFRLRP